MYFHPRQLHCMFAYYNITDEKLMSISLSLNVELIVHISLIINILISQSRSADHSKLLHVNITHIMNTNVNAPKLYVMS